MKKIKVIIFLSLILCMSVLPVSADFIHTDVKSESIVDGVEYKKIDILSRNGYLRSEAILIDKDDASLDLEILRSKKSFRRVDTVTNMCKDNTLAAINASFFFEWKGGYESIGTEINNSEFVYGFGDQYNQHLGTVCNFSKYNSDYLFQYLSFNGNIVNQRGELLKIKGFNSFGLTDDLIIFTNKAFKNTKEIKNAADITMFLVDNDVIVAKIEKGQNFDILDSQYILAYRNTEKNWFENLILVGDSLKVNMEVNVDLNNLEFSIPGGGVFLENRNYKASNFVVGGKVKHPRTAIGIDNKDNKIIFVTVDGRGSSVGANEREMADIMLLYGADNAIHFDGGGSTTMTVRNPFTNKLEVRNIVSDGNQRAVINALGVNSNRQDDESFTINIKSDKEYYLTGDEISLDVAINNSNGRAKAFEFSDLKFSANLNGEFNENKFYPSERGKLIISVDYKGKVANLELGIIESYKFNLSKEEVEIVESELEKESRKSENLEEGVNVEPEDYLTSEKIHTIALFGNTSGRNCLLDDIVMDKVYSEMNKYNHAVFFGYSDVDEQKLDRKPKIFSNKFYQTTINGLSFINLATKSNSFIFADSNQYNLLKSALNDAKSDTIVIVSEYSISDRINQTYSNEATMFHNLLREFSLNSGKNILFVSQSYDKNDINIIDGINYLKTKALYMGGYIEKELIYNQYTMPVICIVDGRVSYYLKRLY